MNAIKKLVACLLALSTALMCFGCGESTANAMSINNYDVRAGVYIYYCLEAYYDAINQLNDKDVDLLSAEDAKDLKKKAKDQKIEDKALSQWIQDKAEEYCQDYIMIKDKFNELEYKLTSDEEEQVEQYVASSWSYMGEFYKDCGVSEESLSEIFAYELMRERVFEYFYGDNGIEGVKADDLKDYYKENYARVQYLKMSLTDGEGNLLKADGKAEIKKMAEGYLARLKKTSDTKGMMTEFDTVISEYKAYATSLSAAAVTTTDESGNLITTPTTTTSTTTTTTVTTTEAGTGDASATTTVAGGDETAAPTTTTTSTSAPDSTGTGDSTETTTTTPQFPNETIISKSTSADEADKAEDGQDDTKETTTANYTPSEKTYTFIFNDAKIGEPELIEEDENYYIVLRLDIAERMTDTDLWTKSTIKNIRSTMFADKFNDLMDTWNENYPVKKNEKAIKRYDPLDLDLLKYSEQLNAMYQSYYQNLYGG